MKHCLKIIIAALGIVLLFGCSKVGNLPTMTYTKGVATVLSSSVTKIAATATDSLKTVLVLKWTNPNYATSLSNTKYVIQFDSSGRGFSKAISFTVTGSLIDSFTAQQLNNVLLGFNFNYNVAYNVDLRVISSYVNNNDLDTSNILTISMTPYVTPPVIAPPTSGTLFLVGDATQGGWSNPVPVPTQQFEQLDSVTYGGVFNLIGGNSYVFLPVNGSWSQKYAVISSSVPTSGTSFQYYTSGGSNIPAPAASGWYTITVDFQHGIYTVVPYTSTFPTNLYIVGSATADGWNNSNPPVNPVFTQLDAARFQVMIPLIGGGQYLLLPVAGSWTNKYAVANANVPSSGGSFGYNLSTNFNAPATSGTYTITANFYDLTFTVK
jgi:hypothetical protein